MTREPGFYWVRYTDWKAAEYHPKFGWFECGSDVTTRDSDYAEIEERRITRGT